jgi:hypothetical protein
MDIKDEVILNFIESIDWNPVIDFCKRNAKGTESELLATEKSKLFKRIQLMLQAGIPLLNTNRWTIAIEHSVPLEMNITFKPMQVKIIIHENDIIQAFTTRISKEYDCLYKILIQYQDEGKYELCELIKNRMLEIVNEK